VTRKLLCVTHFEGLAVDFEGLIVDRSYAVTVTATADTIEYTENGEPENGGQKKQKLKIQD